MHIFRQLARSPQGAQNLYLPTMPQDETLEAKAAVDARVWYQCSTGHAYAIGECGQPMETSKCITCGALVGGKNHVFTGQNVRPAQL
ncbi:MAG: hypothetical protein ACK559_22085, partial [bacterium]